MACSSASGPAPWTGIEIDEVHRVGLALDEHVGDDNACVRGMDSHGETRSRRAGAPRRRADTSAPPRRVLLRASRYYQTGERFIHPPRSMEVYAKSVKIFKDAAAILPLSPHRAGGSAVRG